MSVLPSEESAAAVLGTLSAHCGGKTAARLAALRTLLAASRHLAVAVKRELARSAQTDCGFCVLGRIAADRTGDINPMQIAAAVGLPVADVIAILGRLEVSGLIAQCHPNRGRGGFAIVATPAGRRAFAAACRETADSLAEIVSAIPARELNALQRACVQLDAALNRVAGSTPQRRRRSAANVPTRERSIRRRR